MKTARLKTLILIFCHCDGTMIDEGFNQNYNKTLRL